MYDHNKSGKFLQTEWDRNREPGIGFRKTGSWHNILTACSDHSVQIVWFFQVFRDRITNEVRFGFRSSRMQLIRLFKINLLIINREINHASYQCRNFSKFWKEEKSTYRIIKKFFFNILCAAKNYFWLIRNDKNFFN